MAVVGATLPTDLRIEREILSEVDAEVVDARQWTKPDTHQLLARAQGVLTEGFFPFDFGAMRRCRGVGLYAIGYDQIDVAAADEAGIAVTNAPDYCVTEVADHAMALLLATWRALGEARLIAAADRWSVDGLRPIGRLAGSTLGLIGFGAIARGVARRAQAFGLRVVAHDGYVDRSIASALDVEMLPLLALLSRSDAISIHLPLTDETAGLVGATELDRLRDGAVIVNTSRGGVVDERALLRVLDSGHVRGAGLDVLQTEPPSSETSRLLATHERVICTPHMAYYSEEALADLRRTAAEALAAVLRGERHPLIFNHPILDRGGVGK